MAARDLNYPETYQQPRVTHRADPEINHAQEIFRENAKTGPSKVIHSHPMAYLFSGKIGASGTPAHQA